MSSETDQPRQRTVAELLAAHGDVSATGGRRRRRRAEEPDDVESPSGAYTGPPFGAANVADPQVVPDRRVLREPVPPDAGPLTSRIEPPRRNGAGPAAPPRIPERPPVERPTDQIPRITAAPFEARNGAVAPPRPLRRPEEPPTVLSEPVQDGGPPTMLGAPPVGAPLVGARGGRRRAVDDDGGPPTQAGTPPLDLDDRPAGLEGDDVALVEQDYDDEYDADELDDLREDLDDEDGRRSRRRSRTAAAVGESQGWAAVVAQWIIGAIGGAALWVGFRFLWRDLPVVAVAAAVLVTVGLVLLVRQLLRTTDLKTTIFAVLVGLLLTVSPVLLLLLGK